VIKDGSDVRLYSKNGAEYSNKLPGMRKAFAELPTNSANLDGELCVIDPRGGATYSTGCCTRCTLAGHRKGCWCSWPSTSCTRTRFAIAPGHVRELRKQMAILEREIAELERV
jgi:hypothetical protein